MKTSVLLTIIGFSSIMIYIIIQILNFYGVGSNVYGIYLAFFVFILLSLVILPNNYPTLGT